MKPSFPKRNRIKKTLMAMAAFLLVPRLVVSGAETYNWGMCKDDVVKKHLGAASYSSFSPSAKPEYDNKILNFILAINNDTKEKISIMRSAGVPERDYLLINGKLYSVLENYGAIPSSGLDRVIGELSSTYKSPTVQKDKNMVTYSFYGKDTKVLVLSSQKQNLVDCKVYHYAGKLFRILISE